ncbi:MAG TPA: VOC family protein [Actinomycetota bacterium]|nr:VOC family protein [Actinomycetota bacterium]
MDPGQSGGELGCASDGRVDCRSERGQGVTSPGSPPWFRWNGVCLDCAPDDFERMIALYRDMFGIQVLDKEERWAMLGDPAAGMNINIQAEDWYVSPVWPELADAQTKMMHFEIEVDHVERAVARAISLGALQAPEQPTNRDLNTLRVMLDPAGHPFCLWSRHTPDASTAYWHDR